MKLILENWREYHQEAEFDAFIQEHFAWDLNEGIGSDAVDWVINKGNAAKDTVKNVIKGMKDWTHEKIVKFVRHMSKKLEEFIAALRKKGLLKKYKARSEVDAIKLLRTKKHIDLAVLIFSTIAKMTGGFIVDKVVKLPEIIEKVMNILESLTQDTGKEALKALFGDALDIVDMIKKFIDYRRDKETLAAKLGLWADFGGLAEEQL